ncbi:hypothetical protein J2800_003910 [Caulobacter rhizosphaerae]|jgi:hypothetical protein|uniref:Uncharacterized protein n=1 Tax=Caulobacter rhizosphaerae TaxID=2010972 RepID=A0ABU1N3X4_9CAUL|nr:hypothetical protein [Caulobacter rhizosphaerae]MDR6533149.1 hypothetical protein [Caulobacter rhizosphaerae]
MSFKTELAMAREDAKLVQARRDQEQARQAEAAHVMATDPDRYWARYYLTDDLVMQAIRGAGSFSISLPATAFGSQTAARLDEFRDAGADVEVLEAKVPAVDGGGTIVVKRVTIR